MRYIKLLLLFGLFFPLTAQYTLDRDVLIAGMDQLLEEQSAQNTFRGQLVVNKGGEIIYTGNSGYANFKTERPYTEDTRFGIASVTKVFTAASILLLEQDGLLKLEDPALKYLPELKAHPTVTIEQMVRHTTGLQYASSQLRKRLKVDKREVITYTHVLQDIEANPMEELFPSGEKSNYNNINYCMLAVIIERLSGESYPDFVQQRIFEPLGMSTAEFKQQVVLEDDLAYAIPHITKLNGKVQRYSYCKAADDYGNPSSALGSYGIYISMKDLSQLRKLWGTTTVLSQDNIDRLTGYDQFPSGDNNYSRYGYLSTKTPALDTWNIRMSGTIPGFVSFVIYFPEYDLSIAMATNNYRAENKWSVAWDTIDFYAELKPVLYKAYGVDIVTNR